MPVFRPNKEVMEANIRVPQPARLLFTPNPNRRNDRELIVINPPQPPLNTKNLAPHDTLWMRHVTNDVAINVYLIIVHKSGRRYQSRGYPKCWVAQSHCADSV
jgi:hypothetical protein